MAAVLKSWDRCADNESRGAVLFKEWVDAIGFHIDNPDLFHSPWLEEDPMNTPIGIADITTGLEALRNAGKKVRLTPSQVAIAKKLGVPLEEYAKYVKE